MHTQIYVYKHPNIHQREPVRRLVLSTPQQHEIPTGSLGTNSYDLLKNKLPAGFFPPASA